MRTPELKTHKSYDRSHSYFTPAAVIAMSGLQETRRQVTWIGISRRQNWSIWAHIGDP